MSEKSAQEEINGWCNVILSTKIPTVHSYQNCTCINCGACNPNMVKIGAIIMCPDSLT